MREQAGAAHHDWPCRWLGVFVILLVVAVARAQEALPAVEAPAGDQPQLLAEPFETPRQLLRLLDIGDSDWNSFRDGQPLLPDDLEALVEDPVSHAADRLGMKSSVGSTSPSPGRRCRSSPQPAR